MSSKCIGNNLTGCITLLKDTIVAKHTKMYPSDGDGPLRICGKNHFIKSRLAKCEDPDKFTGDESPFYNWRCVGICGAKRFLPADSGDETQWCYTIGGNNGNYVQYCTGSECDFMLCGDCSQPAIFDQLRRRHELESKKRSR